MAFDPVEYLVQKLKEYDASIDTSPGSAVRDLLISPLSSMLASFNETHQILENRLSLNDISSLSEAALDDIAANYLVSRTSGSKAGGTVRIYFKSPQNIIIPKYTEFRSTGGLKFYSESEHSVTAKQMLANTDRYPLYHTGDIQIRAAEAGEKYEVGPFEIKTVVGLKSAYDSVSNGSNFTGGANKDDNTTLYEKLKNSVYSKAAVSNKSITGTLKEHFSTIKDVYIVGADNSLMVRDLVLDYESVGVADYKESDFLGKIAGQHSAPYVMSKAYYGVFIDTNLTNSGYISSEFPRPEDFSREFSQDSYSKIYREDANITSLSPSEVLVYENFDASGYDNSWTLSDERMGLGILAYSGEISVIDGAIKLGNHTPRPGLFLPYQTLVHISGMLEEAINLL